MYSAIIGVPLEEIMGVDGEKGGIPRVVRDCIQYLRETGSFISLSPIHQASKVWGNLSLHADVRIQVWKKKASSEDHLL